MTAWTHPANGSIDDLVATVRALIGQAAQEGRSSRALNAPDFELFRFMRVTENSLSVILADLLNPAGTHGQGALFLEAFLSRLGGHWNRPVGSCHLKLEHRTELNRRIDLTLSLPHGMIGIESKPWAGDGDEQLLHYARFLSKRGRAGDWDWLLVFLCNRPPTADSLPVLDHARLLEAGRFVQLTFRDVMSWLGACRPRCESPKVNFFAG